MTVAATDSAAPFDFRKPARLANDVAGHLEAWQQAICSLVPEKWAESLAYPVGCQVSSRETAQLHEALSQLPDPTLSYYVHVDGGEAPMLFVFARPLGLALVNGMLGDLGEQLPEDRELTTLETSLFEMAVAALVEVLNESQPGGQTVACRMGEFESRPCRTKNLPLDQDVVVTRFEISGPFGGQDCWWLSPEGLLESLSHSAALGSARPSQRQELEHVVSEVPVEIVIRLGAAKLHVKDLANLRSGDIIVLDQRVSEPLVADVQGAEKFRGWPGRLGGRQAFQIQTPTDE